VSAAIGSGSTSATRPAAWLERAPVARTLIALSVSVFAVQLVLTGGASLTHLPPREALAFGASYPFATVGEGRWETLVTACFLHSGVLHLGLNMLVFWMAGPLVERRVGSARMAFLVVVAGTFGNLLGVVHGWFARTSPMTVGSSGVIAGVLAAALVLGWREGGWRGALTQAAARWLVFFVFLGLLSWRLGGAVVDYAAHLGGALAGGVVALAWRRARSAEGMDVTRQDQLVLAVFAALVVGCIAVVSLHDRTDPFARMDLQTRDAFTKEALRGDRCADAHRGLAAVERLRAGMGPVTSLRQVVEATCGHME
jgi:rhomboid protease GluP